MKPVSVVILSHNRLTEIQKNIRLLIRGMKYQDEFEIIIVDNNSHDGSREFLLEIQQKNPHMKLALNGQNLGVAGGRNTGFALAGREFIVALDDDTAIAAEDIRRIPELFAKYSDAGILAFKVVHPMTGELQNDHGDTPLDVANHHGAGFAFRKHLYRDFGGIDEECNFGAEELDFAIRVRASKWRVLYLPELQVFHNSFFRKTDIAQFRRIRRVYNNVRINHKYFPNTMALPNSARYLLTAIYNWFLSYGFYGIHKLIYAAISGRRSGRRQHRPLPSETISYYDDAKLTPEFGNASLTAKIIRKLSSSKIR